MSPVSTDIDGTIRTVLNDGLAGRLDYYTEYLDVARFPEPDYQLAVRDFFRRKYASQTFDVVVATTDAMVDFVNTYRDELFPGAAVVFDASSPRSGPKSTGVVMPLDLKSTIDIAIQLHPDLRHVFVVSGVSDDDRFYAGSGAGAISRVRRPAWLHLLVRTGDARPAPTGGRVAVAHDCLLPDRSSKTAHGASSIALEAFDQVAAVANVPTYHVDRHRHGAWHASAGVC